LENADISKRFKCPKCSQYQSPEHLRNAPKIAEAVSHALSKSRSVRQNNSGAENSGSPPKPEEYVLYFKFLGRQRSVPHLQIEIIRLVNLRNLTNNNYDSSFKAQEPKVRRWRAIQNALIVYAKKLCPLI